MESNFIFAWFFFATSSWFMPAEVKSINFHYLHQDAVRKTTPVVDPEHYGGGGDSCNYFYWWLFCSWIQKFPILGGNSKMVQVGDFFCFHVQKFLEKCHFLAFLPLSLSNPPLDDFEMRRVWNWVSTDLATKFYTKLTIF